MGSNSSGSAQTPPATHFCVLVGQSMSFRHWLRHLRSMAQMSGVAHCERYWHWLSSCCWQTLTPLGPFTHSWPPAQSRASAQAAWHLPKVHDSGLAHSEFMRQLLPTGGEELLEQPAASAPTMTAPTMSDFIRVLQAKRCPRT